MTARTCHICGTPSTPGKGCRTCQRRRRSQRELDKNPSWIRGVPACVWCGQKKLKYLPWQYPQTAYYKNVDKYRRSSRGCYHGVPAELRHLRESARTCKCACRWSTPTYRERHAKWRDANREVYLAKKARHRAAKRGAMPDWLEFEDHDEIKAMYATAQYMEAFTGTPYHVDHIVPLQGDNVCGLHVPWNLRVIPAEDNLRKGNRVPCGFG